MSACPVCLDTESDYKENLIWLECLHPLCTVCLKKLKHKICPLCRNGISDQILETYIPKKIPYKYRTIKIKTRRKGKYGTQFIEYNEVENIIIIERAKRYKKYERKNKGKWAKMSGKTRANRFNKYR